VKKITFLVIGAIAPIILRQMCEVFSADRFSFVVHVDRKANFESYAEGVGEWGHLSFVDHRYEVFWAGFSMIEATLSLARQALRDPESHYFALISDDTFPLLSPDSLYRTILDEKGTWIQSWRIPEDHLFQQRYNKYFFLDSRFTTPRWFPTEERSFSEHDRIELLELEILKSRGKKKLSGLYAGKQWWVLNRNELTSIIELDRTDEHLRQSFRFSAVTDEIYIQTLFKMLFPDSKHLGNPMLDDFSRDPKPYVFSSWKDISLMLSNIQTVKESGAADGQEHLFLRKIAPSGSDVVQMLTDSW